MGERTGEPIVWHEAEHGMFLESPYLREMVEDLKDRVPHKCRRWDMKRMQWWVSDIYLDEVDNILFDHFERHGAGRS